MTPGGIKGLVIHGLTFATDTVPAPGTIGQMGCLMIPDLLRCRFARGATNLHRRGLMNLRTYGRIACRRKPDAGGALPDALLAGGFPPPGGSALPVAPSNGIKFRGRFAAAWGAGFGLTGFLIFILNV